MPEQRKTVTILFCDLAGSTALGESVDPERLRTLLASYFERMKEIVEYHGGTVEKFIGDAVMAVFGVPTVREDDALRTVRAALEMRDALPDLGLEGRIGVMTGVVVTGTEERLATGDAVNVAARLEQAATAGEVLIGDPTLALVRGAVDVEPVEPLDLKGKAERVPAYRLLRVHETPERRHDAPFVGRTRERDVLREAWERVHAGGACELVTVVGAPGVGKSRLAAEFLGSIDASMVRGRCLPYGEGITYWPVAGVLKQLGVVPTDPVAASAIRSVLGANDVTTSSEEIAWAVRKTLEQAASASPLIVVLDDIQWGDEAFLDLVEHVALLSTGAAILLLCLARPELADLRPGWPVTLRLEPLGAAEVDELIPGRIPAELRERIARAAGGNPLFVEEMVAMADETTGDVDVPPTLRALLAARIDQLEGDERGVLERGAIEGEIFHRGAVQALTSTEAPVTPRLASLVRKELIRPDAPAVPGQDGFRFRHLLIRDAAYDALPKAARADLHAQFATWLEQHGTELVELDELVGYHLEQACRYRLEVGLPDDRELRDEARRRLGASGRRAALRRDVAAAASLLDRAVALVQPTRVDVALELQLARVLYEAGRGTEAIERAESLAERSMAVGDRAGELAGRIEAGYVRLDVEPDGASTKLDALIGEALLELPQLGNVDALFTLHRARGMTAFTRGQTTAAVEAFELADGYARQAGIPDALVGWRALSRIYGRTSVSELMSWLDENEPRNGRDYWLCACRGLALAMTGHFDQARAMLEETRAELAERGAGLQLGVVTGNESVLLELLAGDPEAASALGLQGCAQLEELEAFAFLSTAAAYLARTFVALDRLEEADDWLARATAVGAEDDVWTQLVVRQAQAALLARRGKRAAALELMREALAMAEATDDINAQGDIQFELGGLLRLDGRADQAASAFTQALDCYERKGNLVSAERVRELLAAPA